MRHCPVCDTRYQVASRNCPACEFCPHVVDGYLSYAPELAHAGGGFEASYFPVLAKLEGGNFWFKARNKLILRALEQYCHGFQSYLEIGCGTGYVLSGVAERFPGVSLSASEIFTAGLGFAAQRVPSAEFMQMDARRIPFDGEFDAIGAYDVLEHIEEDEAVLAQMHKALKPGGHIVLTVPQHAWLWSPSDDYARHERRYAKGELEEKVETAGFKVKRSTSFVSLLLPLMLMARLRSKKHADSFDPTDELKLSTLVNTALSKVMQIEYCLISLGLNFPAGGSRLLVAQKCA